MLQACVILWGRRGEVVDEGRDLLGVCAVHVEEQGWMCASVR